MYILHYSLKMYCSDNLYSLIVSFKSQILQIKGKIFQIREVSNSYKIKYRNTSYIKNNIKSKNI